MRTLLFLCFVACAGRTPAVTSQPAPEACHADDDCVPAQACHPTSCTTKDHAPLKNQMCTMSCEGPIDCGAGTCGCDSGRCVVRPAAK